MKRHTSFRVGGPATCFVTPEMKRNLLQSLRLVSKNETYFILGNGSNLLVGDQGFDGVVISMDSFNSCHVNQETGMIKAGAGLSLARIAQEAYKASLTGFEFAAGIPEHWGEL